MSIYIYIYVDAAKGATTVQVAGRRGLVVAPLAHVFIRGMLEPITARLAVLAALFEVNRHSSRPDHVIYMCLHLARIHLEVLEIQT